MFVANILQSVSLLVVAITLILTTRQIRYAGQQTQESAEQSTLARSALTQTTLHSLVDNGGSNLLGPLYHDPELLAWFLASRGITPASPEINRRYHVLFLRLDVHESMYLAHLDGALAEAVWFGWRWAIVLDAGTAEFQALWPAIRKIYSSGFAALVDEMVAPARSVELAGVPVDVDQQVPQRVVERTTGTALG